MSEPLFVKRRIVVPRKADAVNAFVAGKSISDIAQDTASHRLRVEQVIREAIIGLAALKVPSTETVESTEAQTV